MPDKWNIMVATSKEFTPLFTGSINTIYAPGTNLLIIFPTFQYNIATNLDANLVWQSFFLERQNNFQAVSHRGFLRIKWSYEPMIIIMYCLAFRHTHAVLLKLP
jgi:hypothetical protein